MVKLKNRAVYKGLLVALLIIIVATLTGVNVPARVSVSEGGYLSWGSGIALAVNNPPTSEITNQHYQPGDEVIEKRTRSSKTHWLGGNSYSWDGTIGSIHYEDNGWQEIDNIFEPAVAPWDWQMLEAGYHIRVKEDFTAGQIIEFEVQGETVQLQPMNLEWTNDLDMIQLISIPQSVVPIITNPEVDLLPAVGMPSHQGTIRWDDAYGQGIDFEWRCTSTRLVKILEIESLNKLPSPQQYILDGGNPVLRLNLIFDPPNKNDVDILVDGQIWNVTSKKQTFNVVEFRKDGEVLWGFMPLKYWDSSEEGNHGQSIATLEKRGNKLYISIRVPYSWLQGAVYPVFIDTDVDKQIADTNANDGSSTSTAGFLVSNIYIGYHSAVGVAHAFLRWTGVSIEGTIGANSWIELYRTVLLGSPLTKVYGVNEDNPAAPTSTGEFSADPLTAEGGAVDWDGFSSGWNQSPGLATIFQELVDSFTISNDAVMVQIKDDGTSYGGLVGFNDYNDAPSSSNAKLHIEYEVGAEPDISNEPSSENLGIVEPSTTYYAYGSAPSNPVQDGECTFTVTNNSGANVDITIEADDFTGGVGWALTSGAPGENTVKMIAYYSGQDPASGVTLTTSPQAFISGLADSGTKKWDFSLQLGDFTDGAEKTSTITLSAVIS